MFVQEGRNSSKLADSYLDIRRFFEFKKNHSKLNFFELWLVFRPLVALSNVKNHNWVFSHQKFPKSTSTGSQLAVSDDINHPA
jgi:hypothetical protein